jgi:hypothetical protein
MRLYSGWNREALRFRFLNVICDENYASDLLMRILKVYEVKPNTSISIMLILALVRLGFCRPLHYMQRVVFLLYNRRRRPYRRLGRSEPDLKGGVLGEKCPMK